MNFLSACFFKSIRINVQVKFKKLRLIYSEKKSYFSQKTRVRAHFCLDPFKTKNACSLYINLACLFVCLSVCLYQINVKTGEPIGPKFFVGHLGTPGKV